MKITAQKHIEFNSPIEVLYDPSELRKAILWYTDKPTARLKHVFLYGKYYAVSIYDQKIHIHRLLMMYWIKRELQTNEYVHHKNENKFNNHKYNLEILPASVHQSITNKGRKQSPEHVAKRTSSMKKTRYENPELLANQ